MIAPSLLTRAQQSCRRARNEVLCQSEGLVRAIAQRCLRPGCALDDLCQQGLLAVNAAIDGYDPGRAWLPYVSRAIRNAVQREVADQLSRGCVSPSAVYATLYGHARSERLPLPTSLDAPVGESGATLADAMSAGVDPEELTQEAQRGERESRRAWALFGSLSKVEQMIVQLTVMADEPVSLEACGKKINRSREAVRKVRVRIIKRLGALAVTVEHAETQGEDAVREAVATCKNRMNTPRPACRSKSRSVQLGLRLVA